MSSSTSRSSLSSSLPPVFRPCALSFLDFRHAFFSLRAVSSSSGAFLFWASLSLSCSIHCVFRCSVLPYPLNFVANKKQGQSTDNCEDERQRMSWRWRYTSCMRQIQNPCPTEMEIQLSMKITKNISIKMEREIVRGYELRRQSQETSRWKVTTHFAHKSFIHRTAHSTKKRDVHEKEPPTQTTVSSRLTDRLHAGSRLRALFHIKSSFLHHTHQTFS